MGLRDGFVRLVGGDQYPFHGNFNPGEGSGIGYEDMKVIEAYHFLQSVADRRASLARLCGSADRRGGTRGDDPLLGERRLGRR